MMLFSTIPRSAEAGAGSGGGAAPAAGSPAATGDAGAAPGGGAAAAPSGAGEPPKPFYDSWGLDDQARQFIAGKGYPDPVTFARSAMESDRLARDRNVIPKPDPNNLKGWDGWSELGWKPEPADYQLKRPQTPEGFKYMPAFEDHIRKVAHENRMPLSHAQVMLDAMVGFAVKDIDATNAALIRADAERQTQLKGKWGGDYDRNAELAQRAVNHFGVSETEKALLKDALGDVRVIELFHQIGAQLGEDTIVTSSGAALPASLDALQAELNRLHADPAWSKALNDPRAPNHKEVAAQRLDLSQKIAELQVKQRQR